MIDIERNRPKCLTVNDENIISYVYEAALKRKHKIKSMRGFIIGTTRNIYRFKNSKFNLQNKVESNTELNDNTYIQEEDSDEKEIMIQAMEFALEKYYNEAPLSDRTFFEAYVKQEIRSVRKIKEHFELSHWGAMQLINEFKTKIQDYARENETF